MIEKPNIICFGETKLSCPIDDVKSKLKDKIKGYKYRYFSTCSVKGYSGTAVFSKKPINVFYGMDNTNIEDNEGRVITLEFDIIMFIHNSGQTLQRLKYRVQEWDKEFRKYLNNLMKKRILLFVVI